MSIMGTMDHETVLITPIAANSWSYDDLQYLGTMVRAACGTATLKPPISSGAKPNKRKRICAMSDDSMMVEIIVPYDKRVRDLIEKANRPKVSESERAALAKQAHVLFVKLLGKVIVSNPSSLEILRDHWTKRGFVSGVKVSRSKALAALGLCTWGGSAIATTDSSALLEGYEGYPGETEGG